ncbi:hypothetical protein IAQ61_001674 [Plenodomus lingam]|uniref:Coenzyme Q-binding protein COQ10 START domain-containing protein n=1 Tax=Leptosphaeria maculans (strain JN3 / isolate v23.1.3 / race Av1-4-5-6-7-8) TaxID=985895 RepID=E4ZFV5_LEPMJ|nr:hypothetical protein LEMA_P063010.1 [Plenodomus lingam JN3]KAH9878402.1 hypothetical protein IAQ61_001674 [Plenodomus lingam]CBX90175.1 hypothetical protein LEMA_P063010.1 [Plenodomus lingam JN3]
MASSSYLRTLRPTLSPTRLLLLPTQQRTFLSNPFAALSALAPQTTNAPPQILTACRTLPYPSAPVYSIIADVPSYSKFLPYLTSSQISQWSAPDAEFGRRWPSEGTLTAGFGGIEESFVSRVYCIPGRFVESVGGATQTSLKAGDIAHHLQETESCGPARAADESNLLTHLRSKWSIEPMKDNNTQVSLAVEFAFANPIYSALSANVAPKVADFMIRAFEKRVQEVLDANPKMIEASLGEMEGSELKR